MIKWVVKAKDAQSSKEYVFAVERDADRFAEKLKRQGFCADVWRRFSPGDGECAITSTRRLP